MFNSPKKKQTQPNTTLNKNQKPESKSILKPVISKPISSNPVSSPISKSNTNLTIIPPKTTQIQSNRVNTKKINIIKPKAKAQSSQLNKKTEIQTVQQQIRNAQLQSLIQPKKYGKSKQANNVTNIVQSRSQRQAQIQ